MNKNCGMFTKINNFMGASPSKEPIIDNPHDEILLKEICKVFAVQKIKYPWHLDLHLPSEFLSSENHLIEDAINSLIFHANAYQSIVTRISNLSNPEEMRERLTTILVIASLARPYYCENYWEEVYKKLNKEFENKHDPESQEKYRKILARLDIDERSDRFREKIIRHSLDNHIKYVNK